jgi:hypothetical protein
VKLFRKCIASLLLSTLLAGNIFALDEEGLLITHSLEELPSSQIEEVEDTDIQISKLLELPEEEIGTISLIAARESFNNQNIENKVSLTPSLVPTFMILPYENPPSTIDVILQNMREEALTSQFIGEDIARSVEGKTWNRIKLDKKTRINKEISRFRGNIQAELPTETEIRSEKGDILLWGEIGIYEATGSEAIKWNAYFEKKQRKATNKKKWQNTVDARIFEFGIPGKHLIFSKPVKVSLDTPNMTDGIEMEIAVLHEWDTDFNTSWLSTSPDALCNTDGTTTIPGNITHIQWWKVTFYTCGASSFIMNPTGWSTGSNDLKLIIWDCGQFQLYYNSGANVYTGNPPATGCNNTLDSWIALRIGTTTYGSDWTAWSTNSTTGTTIGNSYTGRTTLTRVVTGRTYTLILDWRYTAPNKYFNIDWSMTIPAWNTRNVRFYLANDSTVGWADADDVGYTWSLPSQTVWVFDSLLNQMSAIRYLSGALWTAQEADGWNTVRTRITNGTDFTNNIQTTPGDLWFWVNWNFGTTAGTRTGSLEWRMLPYSTGSIVDLIPGIAQPEWPLTVNYLSQIPITITNAGTISSSGNHTTVVTIPANIIGPASSFSDNGWSCGAQSGSTVTCTKITTIASLGTDTIRVPVTPTLAASGTMVTFTGTISNSGDSILTNNSAFASNAVVSANLTINPGWVASPMLWLKANNGTNCSTSGCTITTWSNSGSVWTWADAITASWTVIYSASWLINGNPTLYFNNASLNTNNTLSINSIFSIFTVTNMWTNGKFPIGTQTGITNGLDWITTPTYDSFKFYAWASSYSGTNSRTVNLAGLTSSIRTSTGLATGRTNGLQYLGGTLATAIAASSIRIWWTRTTSWALASVWEVIIYNTTLTGTNLNKVESYLATKYGITLNQSTPTNYTLSNGSLGMNGAVMTWYLNNIAGIARDDNSSLSQKSSQSITNTGDIRVTVSSIGTNYGSLYWWNNGTATGTLVTTDIATWSTRITREWQFEENNSDIGTVTVSYPVAALPWGFTGTLMLFKDIDGIFATGSTAYTGTLNWWVWDFSLNIADGDFITFWKVPPVDSIPPIIISNSIASGALLPIWNFGITLTYSDTGSLIDTGSFSGQIYSWNTGSSTWNAVNLAPSYMTISWTTTTTTGVLNIGNLPFGKYRFDIIIADIVGNITTQSYTYFVDRVDWTIDSDVYNIWDVVSNTTKFWTGELVITVFTLWAGFTVSTAPITNFVSIPWDTISYWDGNWGWGYDLWSWVYSGVLTSHSPTATLATQAQNINQNGERNSYIYRIKYGAKVDAMQAANDYVSTLRFNLNLTY